MVKMAKTDKIFLQGNMRMLTNFFQRSKDKFDLKLAYFGNNFLSDVGATYEFDQIIKEHRWKVKWDPIAVIEEFSYAEKAF
jgi:hypothetical protein